MDDYEHARIEGDREHQVHVEGYPPLEEPVRLDYEARAIVTAHRCAGPDEAAKLIREALDHANDAMGTHGYSVRVELEDDRVPPEEA
jgi:hypothetical protein